MQHKVNSSNMYDGYIRYIMYVDSILEYTL